MLKLSEFRHNHHPSEVRMLAKFIRRGFSGLIAVESIVGRCSKYDESVIPYYQIVNQKLSGDISGGVSCEAGWAGASPAALLSAGIP